jgi:cold shock CspA family protein
MGSEPDLSFGADIQPAGKSRLFLWTNDGDDDGDKAVTDHAQVTADLDFLDELEDSENEPPAKLEFGVSSEPYAPAPANPSPTSSWMGGALNWGGMAFGGGRKSPVFKLATAIAAAVPDAERCAEVRYDPDTGMALPQFCDVSIEGRATRSNQWPHIQSTTSEKYASSAASGASDDTGTTESSHHRDLDDMLAEIDGETNAPEPTRDYAAVASGGYAAAVAAPARSVPAKPRPSSQPAPAAATGPATGPMGRFSGVVLWFEAAKKMGFIKPNKPPPGKLPKNVFVHESEVRKAGLLNLLTKGTAVEYAINLRGGREVAVELRLLGRAAEGWFTTKPVPITHHGQTGLGFRAEAQDTSSDKTEEDDDDDEDAGNGDGDDDADEDGEDADGKVEGDGEGWSKAARAPSRVSGGGTASPIGREPPQGLNKSGKWKPGPAVALAYEVEEPHVLSPKRGRANRVASSPEPAPAQAPRRKRPQDRRDLEAERAVVAAKAAVKAARRAAKAAVAEQAKAARKQAKAAGRAATAGNGEAAPSATAVVHVAAELERAPEALVGFSILERVGLLFGKVAAGWASVDGGLMGEEDEAPARAGSGGRPAPPRAARRAAARSKRGRSWPRRVCAVVPWLIFGGLATLLTMLLTMEMVGPRARGLTAPPPLPPTQLSRTQCDFTLGGWVTFPYGILYNRAPPSGLKRREWRAQVDPKAAPRDTRGDSYTRENVDPRPGEFAFTDTPNRREYEMVSWQTAFAATTRSRAHYG